MVNVFTAEVRVAIGRFDFNHIVTDFQNRNIKSAATEVKDGNLLIFLFVESVGEGGGGRLVDDAEDFESGDLTGGFGGVTLGVVEIGGHGDHRLGNFLADFRFRVCLQLFKHALN